MPRWAAHFLHQPKQLFGELFLLTGKVKTSKTKKPSHRIDPLLKTLQKLPDLAAAGKVGSVMAWLKGPLDLPACSVKDAEICCALCTAALCQLRFKWQKEQVEFIYFTVTENNYSIVHGLPPSSFPFSLEQMA